MDAADRGRAHDPDLGARARSLLTWLVGLENDVYFQVGLVTLVGPSAKNAILICEVAIEHVREGMSARDAALAAAGRAACARS